MGVYGRLRGRGRGGVGAGSGRGRGGVGSGAGSGRGRGNYKQNHKTWKNPQKFDYLSFCHTCNTITFFLTSLLEIIVAYKVYFQMISRNVPIGTFS